ncbi:MAG TPA: DUF5076 domain-containing protein [Candidatus Acidoferrales bacterium]|jgi:hypothetical protein|nr:DUF5076 domain-containing protein [Candidatus Acidoferrales bacterium]
MSKPINYVPDQSLPREVIVPPTTVDNKNSREFIRAWFDGDKVDVAVQAKAIPRPEAIGMILADIVKHVCVAHGHAFPANAGDDAEKIMEVLLTELGAIE